MYNTLIILDDENNNDLLMGMPGVITFKKYLHDYPKLNEKKTRIINLCSTKRYLSKGYYCSLLAEARKHHVLPNVKAINEFRNTDNICYPINPHSIKLDQGELPKECLVFFGETDDVRFQKIAKKLFYQYACPILKIRFDLLEQEECLQVEAFSYASLTLDLKQLFIKKLKEFSSGVWRSTNKGKKYRWDMAILISPEEKLPPSNREAIARFIKAASKYGIFAEAVSHLQIKNINQYDALFIRETTAINHHTYQLASLAEKNDLVVIDDPTSILRCCNKVYLHDAFSYQGVPSLKTEVVSDIREHTLNSLEENFNYPLILKMPESSFSKGVFKVNDREGLKSTLKDLLESSSLVLVQEYLYTNYDWRIGVLNNKVLYACRYYMANKHWQIYHHKNNSLSAGKFETIPTFEVPKSVLCAALKATSIIGSGLYGVDIKVHDNHAYVIEINDNPNIDYRVEDAYLGNELYMQIMGEFNRRLELRGR